mgnify:CR=1 FL=1
MKSKSFKAVSVLVCLFLILSVFAACSPKNPDNNDSNTLSPNESWAGGEIVYEPVTISSVELADLVSEALGDEAKDFNGDLSKLTPDQLQKVEDAAKDKGYTVDKDSSGKPVIKKDNVAVTKVSQDEANDILTRASVKDPSKISKDEYGEISKIADDNGLTAVTNGNGGVDIVRPVTRPATRPATDPNHQEKQRRQRRRQSGGRFHHAQAHRLPCRHHPCPHRLDILRLQKGLQLRQDRDIQG